MRVSIWVNTHDLRFKNMWLQKFSVFHIRTEMPILAFSSLLCETKKCQGIKKHVDLESEGPGSIPIRGIIFITGFFFFFTQ